MNDKDKEAFEKWFQTSPRSTRYGVEDVWQAACEYKNKEIDILVEALEKILSCRTCKTHKLGECPSADENNLYIPAWKALKEYRGEA